MLSCADFFSFILYTYVELLFLVVLFISFNFLINILVHAKCNYYENEIEELNDMEHPFP